VTVLSEVRAETDCLAVSMLTFSSRGTASPTNLFADRVQMRREWITRIESRTTAKPSSAAKRLFAA
jgi:hypothetical protein